MANAPLYAWTAPAFWKGNVLDHTWVTSYDNRKSNLQDIAEVVKSGENYWYCWGRFHASGGTPKHPDGFLLTQDGDLDYAKCLATPNLESANNRGARGTIENYGTDGVCHQLANQVLYATGSSPAVVREARGYWFSNALFSTYGLARREWAKQIKRCSKLGGTDMSDSIDILAFNDEFAAHLRATVKGEGAEERINSLLDRRQAMMTRIQILSNESPSAEELNRIYSAFFKQAADILGDENFEAVFGQKPEDEMGVVDPEEYERANNR